MPVTRTTTNDMFGNELKLGDFFFYIYNTSKPELRIVTGFTNDQVLGYAASPYSTDIDMNSTVFNRCGYNYTLKVLSEQADIYGRPGTAAKLKQKFDQHNVQGNFTHKILEKAPSQAKKKTKLDI